MANIKPLTSDSQGGNGENRAMRRAQRYNRSIREIAEMYDVSDQTIRRYIRSGRITAYRRGPRVIRLDPDEVERQLMGEPIRAAHDDAR